MPTSDDPAAVALAAAVLLAGDRIQGTLFTTACDPQYPPRRHWHAMPPESAVAEARELLRLAREAGRGE